MKKFLLLCSAAVFVLSSAWAQERTVSGKVTSTEDGSALPGVNVLVKGTTSGTVTDADGNYKLGLPASGGSLVFSFIGLQTEEIVVGDRTVVDVSLALDVTQLSEVVVSGLATTVKRTNLANSVMSISGAEISGVTRPQTLDGALNGKVVGATISANSGAPGGGFSVRLRGVSSIAQSSEPLYIIDGVYVNNSQFQTGAGTGAFSGATGQTSGTQDQATNRLADINPSDIENIEILKGPSAAAIYGTRANAGVIIITTKKGKAGQTSISFGQDIGMAKALKLTDMHKTNWDLNKISQGIWLLPNADMADLFVANGSGAKTYNYEEEIYGNTGVLSNTRLNFTGGTEKVKYYVAGTMTDETGIQKNTGFTRNSIRMNLDLKLNKFVDFSVNSNYLNSSTSRGFSGNDNNGVSIGYNMAYLPNWLELHPDASGIYPENPITGQNILQIVDKAENNEKTNRFIQSFALNLRLINKANHSLKLAFQGGVDYLATESETYMPDDIQFQQRRANPGASRYTKSINTNTNLQAFLVDEYSVNKLNFTTSLGTVRLGTETEQAWIQGEGLKPGQRNPLTATVRTPSEFFSNYEDVGIVVQEEVNWDDKVILTGGVRFDKSSLNGDNEKYYAFPKASAAVNIASFDFWNFAPVNQFKLRAAYGETGNPAGFGATFTSLTDVIIGGTSGFVSPTSIGNPAINPETAAEFEYGADFGFLNNRISLEATFYKKEVRDFIDVFSLAPGTGVTQYTAYNVGDLENKGIELSLGANVVKKDKISWNTTLSYWQNRTEVTRLIVPEYRVAASGFGAFGTNRVRLGSSPTSWYGTPNDASGQPTEYDNSQPKFQLSWGNNITFLKNFEFSFLLHTSQGNYNSSLNQELTDEGGTSPDWSTLNSDGVPLGVARQLGQPGITTRQFIVDASYVKLREVSLYYNVPVSALPGSLSNAISALRIGVSGNNVAMWTNYYGYDPEASNFGNRPVGTGVDLLSFPSSKRMFFHLNVTF